MTISGPCFTVVLVGDDAFIGRNEPEVQALDELLVIGAVGWDQAVATAVGRSPDIVAVQVGPGEEPVVADAVVRIATGLPATRILAVTTGQPVADAEALIAAGVASVVDIDGPDVLAETIGRLATGEAFLDPAFATAVLACHQAGGSTVPLTPTEKEVVKRLAAGDSVDALSVEYSVSQRLVRLHAGGAIARLHPSS